MSIVGLWSGKNYLKHALADTVTMNKPNTAVGIDFYSTTTVVHGLGYVPLVRCAFDANSNGTIYPGIGQEDDAGFAASIGVPFNVWADDITTTTVVFRAEHTASLAGTFPLYYRIYVDPTL